MDKKRSGDNRKQQGFRRRPEGPKDDYEEKVIKIDRINKVVKGGKRLAFRALVICGNMKGEVSFGLGKAKEVPNAIKKGIDKARRTLVKVKMVDGTLPHEVLGVYGASKVMLRPARPGTGVIAGGAVRILLEFAGFKNVVAKSLGSGNPINTVKAVMQGLSQCRDLKEQVALRGKPLYVHLPASVKEADAKKIQKAEEAAAAAEGKADSKKATSDAGSVAKKDGSRNAEPVAARTSDK
ncbi:MAG: small subunit ribosomal protein S5 [Candidatus Marinamargulisbacteria bacterium]|jgi:small subunit ribosomal protein S5